MCKKMNTIISIGVVGERIFTQVLYNEHCDMVGTIEGEASSIGSI
ncbi:hypothetical protein ACQKND_12380 [Viridibacillus arvi]